MKNDYLQGACCFYTKNNKLFSFYNIHDKASFYIEEEIYLMQFTETIALKDNPIIIFPFFKYEIYDMKKKLIQIFIQCNNQKTNQI